MPSMRPPIPMPRRRTPAWFHRSRVALLAATCLGMALAPARTSAATASCIAGCDFATSGPVCCPADGCASAACADMDDCIANANDKAEKCIAAIPPIGGHCQLTRDLLGKCNAMRAGRVSTCFARLQRSMRKSCTGILEPGCHFGRRAARLVCEACGVAVPTSTTTTTIASPAAAAIEPALVDCQERCIRRVVRLCYDECDDRCGADGVALSICQKGCRNLGCQALRGECTESGNSSLGYQKCCERAGDCSDDVDCEVPTTTTTTSSTTSTATSTTTTTTR